MRFLGLVLSLLSIQMSVSSPLGSMKGLQSRDQQIYHYLESFGYVQKGKPFSKDRTEKGLKKFQHFFKLPESGVLDKATLELIEKPRCGLADVGADIEARYRIYSKWINKKSFTYYIENYPDGVIAADVDSAVRVALDKWGNAGGLTFTLGNAPSDIIIKFASRDHGDGAPFDGPFKVLAHAFFPINTNAYTLAGDIHFDKEETWRILTVDISDVFDIYTVALHEAGHSLGLDHSDEVSAVMYPYYQYREQYKPLDIDDINGIQAIYVG